jgi:hypothetical protein
MLKDCVCGARRDQAACSALFFRAHPSIDATDMLAGDGNHSFNTASFGDNGSCGIKLFFAHADTFATIANLVKHIFAIIALAFFAQFANGRLYG